MKKLIRPDIQIKRYLFLVASAFLIFNACNKTTKPEDPIEGVWELTHNYVLANGDTVYSSDNTVQHKIYLDGYVMWTTDPASDSSEWHGYGTYRLKNDTVIEKLSSMSIPMREQTDTTNEFIILIDLDKNSFKQEISSMQNDTVFKSIEIYKRLGK